MFLHRWPISRRAWSIFPAETRCSTCCIRRRRLGSPSLQAAASCRALSDASGHYGPLPRATTSGVGPQPPRTTAASDHSRLGRHLRPPPRTAFTSDGAATASDRTMDRSRCGIATATSIASESPPLIAAASDRRHLVAATSDVITTAVVLALGRCRLRVAAAFGSQPPSDRCSLWITVALDCYHRGSQQPSDRCLTCHVAANTAKGMHTSPRTPPPSSVDGDPPIRVG